MAASTKVGIALSFFADYAALITMSNLENGFEHIQNCDLVATAEVHNYQLDMFCLAVNA